MRVVRLIVVAVLALLCLAGTAQAQCYCERGSYYSDYSHGRIVVEVAPVYDYRPAWRYDSWDYGYRPTYRRYAYVAPAWRERQRYQARPYYDSQNRGHRRR